MVPRKRENGVSAFLLLFFFNINGPGFFLFCTHFMKKKKKRFLPPFFFEAIYIYIFGHTHTSNIYSYIVIRRGVQVRSRFGSDGFIINSPTLKPIFFQKINK